MIRHSTFVRMTIGGLAAIVVPLVATACEPPPSIEVTTTQDELNNDGDCSLREAVQAANTDQGVDDCAAGDGADVIDVPAGNYRLTRAGVSEQQNITGDLDILSVVTIKGAGRGNTFLDGAGLDRVLDVFGGASASVQDLVLRNGLAPPGRRGGAVVVLENGTLNLLRVNVTGSATRTGTGGANDLHVPDGGGLYVDGTATLTDVRVTGNTAGGAEGSGGGIWNSGTLTLVDSSVVGNRANGANSASFEIDGGGGIFTSGTATLRRTTVDANTSAFRGGGIASTRVEGAFTVTLDRSTISNNTGTVGGGLYTTVNVTATNVTISTNHSRHHAGGIWTSGDTRLRSATVALNETDSDGNGTGDGGGVLVFAPGTLTLGNTVFNQNTDRGGEAPSCAGFGAVIFEGYNKFGSLNNCSTSGDTTGNIVGGNALLSPLQDNGGPTKTHQPLAGSPVIDAANPAAPGSGGTSCPTTDQRGVGRPRDGNGDGTSRCDMGAVER